MRPAPPDVVRRVKFSLRLIRESMKHPGPAKNYKKQDLDVRSSSNWGWHYAYETRFPDHENIQRLKKWSDNKGDLNPYQWKIVRHYESLAKRPFGTASWTVVEPNCHFTKLFVLLDKKLRASGLVVIKLASTNLILSNILYLFLI